MASEFHFYERTFNELNSSLTTYVSDVSTNVMSAIAPVAASLLGIYVILWGWAMLRGTISEPIGDGVGRIVRLSVITTVALTAGFYNGLLADMLWKAPDTLGSYVASGYSDGASNSQFLDKLMSEIYDMGDAYWQHANANSGLSGIPDIGETAVAVLLWGVGILATGYGAFLLALSKMALALLLGVGPIFILMTIFEPTKRLFDSWIGQSLNYVFLAMLTAGTIKLMLTILKTYMTDAGAFNVAAAPSISQAMPAFALCLIAALVMMQLPSKASALGGGVAISTLGAVGWAYDKGTGGLSAMRPTNMRRSLNKARSDVRIATGAAKTVAAAPAALYQKVTGGTRNRVARA